MKYDCIIIGAGIAGLISAIKLSKEGSKVLVLEKQPVPGGFATSFKRKGFVFESSIHYVDGLEPEGEIRKFLDEFDISPSLEFIELESFGRIIYPEHNFIATANKDAFLKTLKENFPAESGNLDRLFQEIQKFEEQFDGFVKSKLPGWVNMILLPFLRPLIITTSILTTEQFIGKFIKDKKAAAIINDIWRFVGLPPSRAAALYSLLVFRGY